MRAAIVGDATREFVAFKRRDANGRSKRKKMLPANHAPSLGYDVVKGELKPIILSARETHELREKIGRTELSDLWFLSCVSWASSSFIRHSDFVCRAVAGRRRILSFSSAQSVVKESSITSLPQRVRLLADKSTRLRAKLRRDKPARQASESS
jgi:hypothetical protein